LDFVNGNTLFFSNTALANLNNCVVATGGPVCSQLQSIVAHILMNIRDQYGSKVSDTSNGRVWSLRTHLRLHLIRLIIS